MAIVSMRDITVQYGKNTVIGGLSLEVERGENLAIVGPSSCGKTTLMRALCGFIKIARGEILLNDTVVSSPSRRIMVAPEKRNIGVVFQDYAVWPHFTVFENIVYPMRKRKVPKEEAKERALAAMAQVKMQDFADRLPSQLSGGQQQRVALARALVSSSELIVLDEPITNLDAKLREEMAYEIRNLQKTIGVTVIYITHDQETAMTISDRMVIMDKKRRHPPARNPGGDLEPPEGPGCLRLPRRIQLPSPAQRERLSPSCLVFRKTEARQPGGGHPGRLRLQAASCLPPHGHPGLPPFGRRRRRGGRGGAGDLPGASVRLFRERGRSYRPGTGGFPRSLRPGGSRRGFALRGGVPPACGVRGGSPGSPV